MTVVDNVNAGVAPPDDEPAKPLADTTDTAVTVPDPLLLNVVALIAARASIAITPSHCELVNQVGVLGGQGPGTRSLMAPLGPLALDRRTVVHALRGLPPGVSLGQPQLGASM